MKLTKKELKLFRALQEYLNGSIGDALIVLRYAQYNKYHRAHWLDEYFKKRKNEKTQT